MKIKNILTLLGVLLLAPLASCAKPTEALVAPKKMTFNLTTNAPGDHVGNISWNAVSDVAGSPSAFQVTVRVSLNGGTATTLPGYPKTVSTTSDTFTRVPGATEFGTFTYTVSVAQIRRGLTGPAATATANIVREDVPPPAPTGVTATVTVSP